MKMIEVQTGWGDGVVTASEHRSIKLAFASVRANRKDGALISYVKPQGRAGRFLIALQNAQRNLMSVSSADGKRK